MERWLNSGWGWQREKSNPSAPANWMAGSSRIVLRSNSFSSSENTLVARPFSMAWNNKVSPKSSCR